MGFIFIQPQACPVKIALDYFWHYFQGITTDDDEAFKRFLHELTYSLSEPPSAENDETRNKEFLELISVTRELWQKTVRGKLAGTS